MVSSKLSMCLVLLRPEAGFGITGFKKTITVSPKTTNTIFEFVLLGNMSSSSVSILFHVAPILQAFPDRLMGTIP